MRAGAWRHRPAMAQRSGGAFTPIALGAAGTLPRRARSPAGVFSPLKLLALRGTRRTEPKALDDEGVVVLLLALLVRPGVASDAGLDDELIPLAGTAGDRLAQVPESNEPKARDGFASGSLVVLAGIVAAEKAEAGKARIPFTTSSGLRARFPMPMTVKLFMRVSSWATGGIACARPRATPQLGGPRRALRKRSPPPGGRQIVDRRERCGTDRARRQSVPLSSSPLPCREVRMHALRLAHPPATECAGMHHPIHLQGSSARRGRTGARPARRVSTPSRHRVVLYPSRTSATCAAHRRTSSVLIWQTTRAPRALMRRRSCAASSSAA